MLLWRFKSVHWRCSLRFLKEDTKTVAFPLWSITLWVRGLKNCINNKIYEIFSILWQISWPKSARNWAKKTMHGQQDVFQCLPISLYSCSVPYSVNFHLILHYATEVLPRKTLICWVLQAWKGCWSETRHRIDQISWFSSGTCICASERGRGESSLLLNGRITSLLLPLHRRCIFFLARADASHSVNGLFRSSCCPQKDCLGFFKEIMLHPKQTA